MWVLQWPVGVLGCHTPPSDCLTAAQRLPCSGSEPWFSCASLWEGWAGPESHLCKVSAGKNGQQAELLVDEASVPGKTSICGVSLGGAFCMQRGRPSCW